MSSTRSFKAPGTFAADASTVIPPTPIAGVSYRDAVSGTDDVENGWRYGTRVESQDFNQIMFLATSMLGMLDTQGVLGWSSDVDYTGPAIVFGSDGQLYIKIGAASGPNNGGAKDPISSPTFWQSFTSRFGGSPGDIKMVAYTAIPEGWLKCNGAAISRTTYAALFSAIGGTYGAGDGSTTFNLPDMRGEFPRGWDDGRGVDAGRVFGSGQVDSFKSHTHLQKVVSTPSQGGSNGAYGSIGLSGAALDANIASSGGSETRPRNLALMFVIKT